MRSKEWLKEMRLKLGLSQKEVAEKCDLSIPAIAKIESGERYGSEDTWNKIESVLLADEPIVSYDSDELIENLKDDIVEFGANSKCYLIFKKYRKQLVFTYYILKNNKEMPFDKDKDIEQDENYIEINLEDALKLFETQNNII